jgi:hypothetical protein
LNLSPSTRQVNTRLGCGLFRNRGDVRPSSNPRAANSMRRAAAFPKPRTLGRTRWQQLAMHKNQMARLRAISA